MLDFAEQTGSGIVILVCSFLSPTVENMLYKDRLSIIFQREQELLNRGNNRDSLRIEQQSIITRSPYILHYIINKKNKVSYCFL